MLEPMEQVSDQLVKHLGTFAQENVAASVKPIFEKFSLETIGKIRQLFKVCTLLIHSY